MLNSLWYHILRQRIPFFIFVIYLLHKNTRSKETKIFSWYVIIQIIVVTGFLLLGRIMGIPIQKYIGFRWSYFAAFEWSIFLILVYFYSQHRNHAPLFTVNFMAQAASAGGFLYELPYFVTAGEGRIVSASYVMLFNFQIISTILIPVILYKARFRVNRKIGITVLIYMGFALFNYFNPTFFSHYGWLQRLPTMLMLLTFLSGIPKEAYA